MSVIDFISSLKFWGKGGKGEKEIFRQYLTADISYKILAFETCVSLIANTIASCEFQTFERGKEVRGENYYLFNVKPNQNQNAAEFWHSFVSKLFKNNEVVVVQHNSQFYIADDFAVKEYALYENIYSDVQVGDFILTNSFKASDVFHVKLNDRDVSKLLDGIYSEYGKLLTAAQGNYKRKNTHRLIIDIDATVTQDPKQKAAMRELFDNQFKPWFEADGPGAIAPLYKGMTLNKDYSTANNVVYNTRDIRALIDDIFDLTATACHVPVNLFRGNMADLESQIKAYIMFAIRPPVELIKDEINAKMYTKAQFLSKNYVRIDTSKIQITDIVKLAMAADKLFADGINTINDNLRMFDREEIPEWWANARFVTKNYQTVEVLAKGGGNIEQVQNKQTAGTED